MKDLSARTLNIAASLTVAIDTLAKQMIADGKEYAAHFHVDTLTQELLKTYQRTLNL